MAVIVLAHGAWSSAWAWKRVRPLMVAAGHEFFAPSYTGLGERAHLARPENDLETHIQDVVGVLKFEDLRSVVLIGHSYGGMVATGVADRARDRVAQLIYLDAFVPDDGQPSSTSCPSSGGSGCWIALTLVMAGASLQIQSRLTPPTRIQPGSRNSACRCRSGVSNSQFICKPN